MRNHNLTPKRKKLAPLVKVKLASGVLAAVLSEKIDEKQAGVLLREATGTQWSLLTCLQYLSGKEAIAAVDGLAESWSEDGMTKEGLRAAIKVAAHAVANFHPKGKSLCASDLAQTMKGLPLD
ncbi:hypothetical protein [Stenotrophomonas pigmentata]|uniref:hypothetical protein n=1 Tax=Stenotrophomonas pigmentata TaxID=3055080 RepID=UPI0026F1A81C|nr:hypothetical protein [Stenotrophomonas sp. 610A2]